MKPPKTIRNFVHTLLGTKKRNKENTKSSLSLVEPNVVEFELDKGRRHHRSAEDLLDDNFEENIVRVSSTTSRSRTLPRRSQSSVSGQRPSIVRRYEPRNVRDIGFEFEDDLQSRKNEKTASRSDELKYSRNNFQTPVIPRSTSLNAVWNKGLTMRSQSCTPDTAGSTDEGYDDSIMPPRTTSWSHPRKVPDCQIMREDTRNSQRENRKREFFREEKLRSSASKLSQRSVPSSKSAMRRSGERLLSNDNFLQDPLSFRVSNSSSATQNSMIDDRLSLRTSSRASSNNNNVSADMKMKTCLDVLNRLSARVKEIKEVSKRVEKVESRVKNGSLPVQERERRLMELDMAEAASARLKSILKSDCVGESAPGRSNSRISGYNSTGSGRRSSDPPSQAGSIRTCRPLDKRLRNNSYNTAPQPRGNARQFYDDRREPHFPPNGPYTHAPYPMSVSDMMPLWDTKEIISHPSKERQITREDSMSSGYATGSGSEDGRHESPLANDTDSVMSVYSMMIPGFPYNTQQPMNWQNEQYYSQQPYNGGYGMKAEQDPYAIYGTYHPIGLTGNEIEQESIYGNYGQPHGYASSSVNDQEIYSNGWYQLPANQHGAHGAQQHYSAHTGAAIMPKVENTMQMNAFPPAWNSATSYPAQTPHKYGGLEDIFYNPNETPAPTIMENITNEAVRESQMAEEQTWKSYGSFRYRNGQKMVLPCNSNAARKRKTVRFSQTVRQRIETEESEMEDSTSVIKGGEDNESSNTTKTIAKSDQEFSDSSSIYMSPRDSAVHNSTTETAPAAHKPLPEPIYEFPSGHIESSCMCGDCILARGSCQMQSAQVTAYY